MARYDEKSGPATIHVVALIHGIRTQAYWQGSVAWELKKVDPTLEVVALKYDFFDLFHFWCPLLTRGGPVQRIEDEIANIRERFPKAELSVIAHSFGTYIIGEILLRSTVHRFHRLILCGAVLKRDYPWSQVYEAIEKVPYNIVNDYSPGDILPALAQAASWGYGGAGTHGFGSALVEDRLHAGGHGDYFKPGFAEKFWAPLLAKGEYVLSGRERKPPPSSWPVSILGILKIQYLLLLSLGWLGFSLARPFMDRLSARPGPAVASSDRGVQWTKIRPFQVLPPELEPVSRDLLGEGSDVIPEIRDEVTNIRKMNHFANAEGTAEVDCISFATGPMRAGSYPKSVKVKTGAALRVFLIEEVQPGGKWASVHLGRAVSTAYGTVTLDSAHPPDVEGKRTCVVLLLFPLDQQTYAELSKNSPQELFEVIW